MNTLEIIVVSACCSVTMGAIYCWYRYIANTNINNLPKSLPDVNAPLL